MCLGCKNICSSNEIKLEEKLRPEPPTLKIRIFMGNSGEQIDEKEVKQKRKRKKKTINQKVKQSKLTLDTSKLNRKVKELPGCNLLEDKIKNATR